MAWKNWSGCRQNLNAEFHTPVDIESLQALLKRARAEDLSVSIVGAGHSFSDLFATDMLISLSHFAELKAVNEAEHQLVCGAGMSLLNFYKHCEDHHLTLPTFPVGETSTLGGIMSTPTHGSGRANTILANHMISCLILTASGDLKTVQATDPAMPAIRAGLGQLGIILELTIQCEPAFLLRRQVLIESPKSIFSQYAQRDQAHDAQHVFWFVGCQKGFVSLLDRVEQGECDPSFENMNRRAFEKDMHEKIAWTLRFPQITRLINTKIFNRHIEPTDFIAQAPRAFLAYPESKLVNAEWGVSEDSLSHVVTDITDREKNGQAFQGILEIRSVAPDENYLSHAYQRQEVMIGNTVYGDFSEPPKVLRKFSEVLQAHEARPHLAKACTYNRRFESLFPAYSTFEAIRREWDPQGLFKRQLL